MDSQAVIAAGMLEAEGASPDAPAADRAATLAEIEAGPTLWVRTKWIQNLDEYRQRVNRHVACWRAPTLAFPDAPEIRSFFAATNYDDLRFEVGSLTDWSALMAQQRPNGAVSAYIRCRARAEWRWRWPLRMGVLASPSAARWVTEARGSGHFGQLYSVFETDGSADCELLFVTRDAIGQSFRKAAIVVVVGVTAADLPADSLDAVLKLGSAGAAVCPGDSLAWVENLVVELSHDSPLDLALAKAVPNAVLLADAEFVARSTVRQWGMELSAALRAGGNEIAAVALDRTLRGRFDHESGEATDVTTVSEVARTTGIDAAVHGSPPRVAAARPQAPPAPTPPAQPPLARPAPMPPRPPPLARPAPMPPRPPPLARPAPTPSRPPPRPQLPPLLTPTDPTRPRPDLQPSARPSARPSRWRLPRIRLPQIRLPKWGSTYKAEPPTSGAPPPPRGHDSDALASPDDRRLQAEVRCRRDATANLAVTDRFMPGLEHELNVRIAAEQRADVVVANALFVPPVRGRALDLEISILIGATRTRRSLTLPPVADSTWTEPVGFRVPADAARFTVCIEVAWQGRVIQSATLQRAPFVLVVDSSEPATSAALESRHAAATQVTLVDDAQGDATVVPALIDLDTDAGGVGEQQIKQATAALRRELLAAFLNPPSSLKDAAGPLTRLAVRGRILYERLAGGADTYHDDDAWIHVNAFTKNDVPIELAYTHPLPSNDTLVPVCPEALAGATSCGKDCGHRNNADVVCPFGFWATSKIIERRRHVDGRSNNTAGAQRQVSPTRSSVVGVSVKADEADDTSSARIIKALGQSVASAITAESWKELEDAAATHPRLLVLVTHTIEPQDGDDLGTQLELHGDLRAIHRISEKTINPGLQQPGPVVLALGCDTNTLTAGYTDLVVNLHNARAEIVLSALSPIPGKGVADFLERFMPLLKASLASNGPHRFGAVMLAARRETIASGDLMALALSATGDADVELTT